MGALTNNCCVQSLTNLDGLTTHSFDDSASNHLVQHATQRGGSRRVSVICGDLQHSWWWWKLVHHVSNMYNDGPSIIHDPLMMAKHVEGCWRIVIKMVYIYIYIGLLWSSNHTPKYSKEKLTQLQFKQMFIWHNWERFQCLNPLWRCN